MSGFNARAFDAEMEEFISPSVTAKSLKVTIVLDTGALLNMAPPVGRPRIVVKIRIDGRCYTADLATKSLRKAIASVTVWGTDQCVAIIQGKLGSENRILEAGLAVQPRMAPLAA